MSGFNSPWDSLRGGSLPPTNSSQNYDPLPVPVDETDAQQEQATFWNIIGNLQAQQTQTASTLVDLLATVQRTIASTSAAPAPVPVATAAPAPTQSYNKPLKFRKPCIFNGKVAEVEPFLDEIKQGIWGQRMQDNTNMTSYMLTYLKDGDPKTWYYSVKKTSPILLSNFAAFVAAFCANFADSNVARTALRKIHALKQTGSCAAYTARYCELLPLVDFSDTTRLDVYKNGLKKEVCECVSLVRPKPATFNDYVALAINFDNKMHKDALEEKHRAKLNGKFLKDSSLQTLYQTSSTTLPAGEPMEIDSVKIKCGPLTAEEKEHQCHEGLCLYCGVKGHFADGCPNKSKAAKKCNAECRAKTTLGKAQ